MTVGEKIRARRIELNMTQEELAKKVGYTSRSSIQKIELSRDMPMKKIKQFAIALDVNPGYLMEDDEMESQNGEYYYNKDAREMAQFLYDRPEYKVLFDAARDVKPEDIREIEQLIRAATYFNKIKDASNKKED